MDAADAPPVLAAAKPASGRRAAVRQFARFGAVGVLGFVWDTATVYALAPLLGLYAAGIVAYLVAATANWLLNRIWTFRDRRADPPHRQWLRFLAANLAGFVLNRGTYVLLIASFPVVRRYPVLAVAAGAAAGLVANFTLSRRYVYR